MSHERTNKSVFHFHQNCRRAFVLTRCGVLCDGHLCVLTSLPRVKSFDSRSWNFDVRECGCRCPSYDLMRWNNFWEFFFCRDCVGLGGNCSYPVWSRGRGSPLWQWDCLAHWPRSQCRSVSAARLRNISSLLTWRFGPVVCMRDMLGQHMQKGK